MKLSPAIRRLTVGLFLFTLGVVGIVSLPAAWNLKKSSSVVGAAPLPSTRAPSPVRPPGEETWPRPLTQRSAGEFDFLSPPTVSLETYQRVYCQPRHGRVSAACPYAPQMYQLLVDAGIDPAIEMAFAAKETEFGATGPGRAPQYNLHNIVCNRWDGSTCDGPYHYRFATYANYLHGLNAWIRLLLHSGRYIDAGNRTFRSVLPIYAPAFENNTALYIAQAESWVRGWRSWEGGQPGSFSSPMFWGAGPGFLPPTWQPGVAMPPAALGRLDQAGEAAPPPPVEAPPPAAPPSSEAAPDPATASPADLPLPQNAMVVDNSDPGFNANQDTWSLASCGVNDEHVVAVSTSTVQQSRSRASWVPTILDTGTYEVRVSIPPCGDTEATRSARYFITHDHGISTMTIDQHAHAGTWVSLGTYAFGARYNPTIEISDLTSDDQRTVRVDAAAWIWQGEAATSATSFAPQNAATPDYRVPWPDESLEALVSRGSTGDLSSPTPPLTPTTLPNASIGRVVKRGYLRTAPQMTPQTAIAQVCPDDQVLLLEVRHLGSRSWLHIRMASTAEDCASDRAGEETEGWVLSALVSD